MYIPEGTIVDKRFRIGAALGSGAMGAVYAATQLDLERDVAIKFLTETAMLDKEDVARFHREAQILCTLNHRNIVRVYAFGTWNNLYYMVLERVEGTSLESYLQRNEPLAKNFVFDVALQLCDGLAAAHAQNIVHRDIKPSNVLITKNGDAKIIDFGFAKIGGPNSARFQKLTEAGTALGTVLYMSPEQCNGEVVDNRADIYSLGAVVHHCLTGHPPFFGSDYLVVMRKQISERVPRLTDVAPDEKFSASMQHVIDNAMAKKRTERYQTIQQMRADIEHAKKGELVILRSMTDAVPVIPAAKDSKKPIGIAVLVSAILSIGALFYFAHHPGQPHSVADESSDMMSVLQTDSRRILNQLDESHTPAQEANLWADLAETYLRMADISQTAKDKEQWEDKSVRASVEAVDRAPLKDKWPNFERLARVWKTKFGAETMIGVVVRIVDSANKARDEDPDYSRRLFKRALKFSQRIPTSSAVRYIQTMAMLGMLESDKLLGNSNDWSEDFEECVSLAEDWQIFDAVSAIQLVGIADMIGSMHFSPESDVKILRKVEAKLEGEEFDKDYHQLARAYVFTARGLVRNHQQKDAAELLKRGQKYAYMSSDKSDVAFFKRVSKEWSIPLPDYKPGSST